VCPGSVCGFKSNKTNRLWLNWYWSGPQFLGWRLLVSWEKRFSIGKNLLTSECRRKDPSLDKSANSVWLKGKGQSAAGAGAVRHPGRRCEKPGFSATAAFLWGETLNSGLRSKFGHISLGGPDGMTWYCADWVNDPRVYARCGAFRKKLCWRTYRLPYGMT
jgi:hypothetical protein